MAKAASASDLEFWPCTGDLVFRLQRTAGIIPAAGLGVDRRAALAVLITWVPLMIAAAISGRLLPGLDHEALLQHFAIHARFLVAVPILILGETVLHAVVGQLIPQFVRSGLVSEAEHGRFADIIHRAIVWRDNWKPWVGIASSRTRGNVRSRNPVCGGSGMTSGARTRSSSRRRAARFSSGV